MKTRPTRAEILAELDRREKAKEGLSGIGEDVNQSVKKIPEAAGKLAASVIPGINNVGNYATHNNPLKTGAQLGGGAIEAGASIASSPQVLARYLAEKFPGMGQAMERGKFHGKGINDPTIFEDLMRLEKENGLEANEEEGSVRNLGGLLSGAGVLRKIPSLFGRTGAIAAESGGRGGDPLHAAILGLLGEVGGKIPYRKAKELPSALMDMAKAVPEKVKQIPQMTANIGQAIGEPMNAAFKDVPKHANQAKHDAMVALAEKLHDKSIPFLPKKILTKAYEEKYKTTTPQQLAEEKVFGDITEEDLPKIQERLDAAKRLKLSFLTPGESLLSPFQSAKEADIGRTKEGLKLLNEKGGERITTERQAINTLLDNIYDKDKLAPEKKADYESAMASTVPHDFITKWKQDPIVEEAIQKIKDKSTYKRAVRGMAEDSFGYWDIVKKVIADMERGDVKGMQKLSSDQATMARNEMVDEMDLINPRYKTARKISEREFTRKEIKDVFDRKDMTINNFWSFLKSEKNFEKLMDKLEPYPEAQQNLKDIRLLSNKLLHLDPSIREAYKLQRTGMTKQRNKFDAMKHALDQKYGEQHDVAAVNLMTHKNFMPILSKFLENKKGTE